jgi:hypothetical protein
VSCKCRKPKRLKNSAGGVDFFVCAKSKGGCGEEIIDLDFGSFNPYDILDKDCLECGGAGVSLKLSIAGYYESRCDYCDGTGIKL